MTVLVEIIGWLATVFRSAGMLCRSVNLVKWLVSAGNLLWMISGILTHNYPLIASNAICLVIMMVDIIRNAVKRKRDGHVPADKGKTIPKIEIDGPAVRIDMN